MDSEGYEHKTLTVRSPDRLIGTISVRDGQLTGTNKAVQALADKFLNRGLSIREAFDELDGWTNGYWFASSSDRFAG